MTPAVEAPTPDYVETPILSPTKHPTMDLVREFTVGSTVSEMSESEVGTREETIALMEEGDDLPPHHAALYSLYGRDEADYYLYPKVHTEKKTDMNKLQQRLGVNTDHADIHDIWGGLRGGSVHKLQEQDKQISQELKRDIYLYRKRVLEEAAFQAFTREGVYKDWETVERSFTQRPDVPELSLLKDRRRITNAHTLRHQVALMNKKSGNNEDTSKILLFNNPLPDLNNMQGAQSINRYLPSWEEEEEDQLESIQEDLEEENLDPHMLVHRERTDLTTKSRPTRATTSGPEYETTVFTEDWDETRREGRREGRRSRKEKEGEGQLVFLTEQDATVPGQFRQRVLERERDAAQMKSSVEASVSAVARIGGREPGEERDIPAATHHRRSQSAATSGSKPVLLWEPLSVDALLDYKRYKSALGAGPFQQGQPQLFRPLHV